MYQNIFIGYQEDLPQVHDVCLYTIKKQTDISNFNFYKIGNEVLPNHIWWRERGELDSTSFSNCKFLVPSLSEFKGLSLFCDDDFLWLCDIQEIFNLYDPKYAVMVTQHNYVPKTKIKFNNTIQTNYDYKNWSSLMLFNAEHPYCQKLTTEAVNNNDALWLHQFKWLPKHLIGKIPLSYNHLIGEYPDAPAKAYHYTLGGPWYENTRNCSYADLWLLEYNEMKNEYSKI